MEGRVVRVLAGAVVTAEESSHAFDVREMHFDAVEDDRTLESRFRIARVMAYGPLGDE